MDQILTDLLSGNLPSIEDINMIVDRVGNIFFLEPPLLSVRAPIHIVGDIHGQYDELLLIFKKIGLPPTVSYLFLGDVVDRGPQSCECIIILFVLKILYSDRIFLLRGNHETREISTTYGFYEETIRKFSTARIWRNIQIVFDYLPICAVVDGRIFAVHGGISRHALSLSILSRHKSPAFLTDLLWSDPSDYRNSKSKMGQEIYESPTNDWFGIATGFSSSTRGSGSYFGPDVTNMFLTVNGLKGLVRSHQLVFEGYKYHFNDKNVMTIWSAPDYCNRMGNDGTVLLIDEDHLLSVDRLIVFKSKLSKNNKN